MAKNGSVQRYVVVEWSLAARALFVAYWIAAFIGFEVDERKASKHVMRFVRTRVAQPPDLIP